MLPQLYHAHHSSYTEDLPFWLELAAKEGDPVLELGCGTGRVLIPMAQAGYHTVGLDHDLSMLKFLQASIALQELHTLLLVAADICRFNLSAKFPLITLPCNTFSTLNTEQQVACLRCVGRHLSEGGVFAVCLPNPELISRLPTQAAAELEDEFIHPDTGNPVQVSSSWRRTKHTLHLTWIYDQLLPDGTVDRKVVNNHQQLNTVNIYLSELENEGLMVRGLYGDFDRSPYTDDSPQLIIQASRS
jgi:SAM-dependent methyltransferase